MADDDDPGQAHLKNVMSEGQNYLANPGKNSGVNSGGRQEKDISRVGGDDDWGGIDTNPYRPRSVNRRGKGDRG